VDRCITAAAAAVSGYEGDAVDMATSQCTARTAIIAQQ